MESKSDFSFMNMMPGAAGADPTAMLKAMQSMQQSWLAAATASAPSPESAADVRDALTQIDQRISDLQAVEQWLTMNLTMLKSTVQGLQMQRATLASIEQMQKGWQESLADVSGQATGQSDDTETSAFDPTPFWNLLQQQFETISQSAMAATGASSTPADDSKTKKKKSGGDGK